MKKKILGLVFLAVFTLGATKIADASCFTFSTTCFGSGEGFTGSLCGSDQEKIAQFNTMYDIWCGEPNMHYH